MKNKIKSIIKNKYKPINTNIDDYFTNPTQFISSNNSNNYKTNVIDESNASSELANIINNLTNNFITLKPQINQKNIDVKNDFNPLIFKHIANDNIAQLENLIKNGKNININQQDKDGDTPLHIAIFLANSKIVKILLENNADPLIIDKWGQTPLHRICFSISDPKTNEIVDIFIQKDKVENLDLFNIQDNYGNTILHSVLKHIIKNKTALTDNHKIIINKINKLTNNKLKNIDGQTINDLINQINLVPNNK